MGVFLVAVGQAERFGGRLLPLANQADGFRAFILAGKAPRVSLEIAECSEKTQNKHHDAIRERCFCFGRDTVLG